MGILSCYLIAIIIALMAEFHESTFIGLELKEFGGERDIQPNGAKTSISDVKQTPNF